MTNFYGAEGRQLGCPRCSRVMQNRELGGGTVAGCSECGGMWLERAVVEHLREVRDEALVAALRREFDVIVLGIRQYMAIQCPVCARPLRRRAIPDSEQDIDVCDEHGTWFDRDELVMLVKAFDAERGGTITDADLQAAGVGTGFFARLFGGGKPKAE
jgi:Zn-finger nucleic acid-binding protein